MSSRILQAIVVLASFFGSIEAFAQLQPSQQSMNGSASQFMPKAVSPIQTKACVVQHTSLQRQRKSVASVQTMGLFGLGAPEIGVILVAAAFLLGPDKLASLGKDAGKIAGELKEVPKEFQRGMEEGEAQAKALKAKSEAESSTVDAVVTGKEATK
jgi:sec-independent protein translocase protein TatA